MSSLRIAIRWTFSLLLLWSGQTSSYGQDLDSLLAVPSDESVWPVINGFKGWQRAVHQPAREW